MNTHVMGVIYLITSLVNNLMYVGQTSGPVHKRWKSHIKAAEQLKKYKNGEIDRCTHSRSRLYHAMIHYGFDKFIFEIIVDDIPNEELDTLEIYFIQEYDTLSPNGYNLTTGGGHFKHHEDTKKLMSELALEAAPKHLDKYRRDETKGLPMYIVSHNKGKSHGFAICGHPLCSYNSFTLTNHNSIEECKQAAIHFLEELEKLGIKYEFQKIDNDLPIGITRFRSGYLVKRKINGIMHKRTFEGRNIPDEQKLHAALRYSESLPE
jgi:group I intron endonuclease